VPRHLAGQSSGPTAAGSPGLDRTMFTASSQDESSQ
jgi:hypothetical protein